MSETYDKNTFINDPELYFQERNGHKRQQLEDKVKYLSYCIRLKIADLEKTKDLHREACRELLGLIGLELAGETESQWLGNE